MSNNMIAMQTRRKLIGTLFTAESLFAAAQIAAFTLMPVIATELSGRDSMAGFPTTAMLLGQAGAAYLIGSFMDRAGRRSGLTIGYLMATIGALLAAAAISWSSFIAFCLGAAMIGMGRGAGLQARFAAAEIQPPDHQARAIGVIVFAGTIGAVVGPLLVAPSQQWAQAFGFSYRTGPYLIAMLLLYGAVMLTFALLRPDPMTVARETLDASATTTAVGTSTERSLWAIFSPAPVRLALAAMLVGQLVMVLVMVITPLHMTRASYSDAQISLVMTGHTLGMFGLAALTGWLIDRVGRTMMIGAGAVVLAVASVMAPIDFGLIWLIAALFLLGLGWNFCFIAGSSLLAAMLDAGERGRAQGTNDMLVALAAGIGSASTGVLFGMGGITLIAGLGVAIASGLLLMTLRFGREVAVAAAGAD
jgi:MFS family permease